MEIIKTTFDDVTNLVFGLIREQKEACVYCVGDENCAIIGSNGGANIEEIKKRNIKYVAINHEGGTIIASPGDVQIGIFTKGYSGRDYCNKIVNTIIETLREKGYKAVAIDNDILIDGKKLAGFGSRMFGEILYTALQVSVSVNLELIQAICTKAMKKLPDGLNNYGMSTQDILDILFNIIPN